MAPRAGVVSRCAVLPWRWHPRRWCAAWTPWLVRRHFCEWWTFENNKRARGPRGCWYQHKTFAWQWSSLHYASRRDTTICSALLWRAPTCPELPYPDRGETMPTPPRVDVRVVPYAHDPEHCLSISLSDGTGLTLARDEAAQLAAELLRHLPPARVEALARELLARPEVQRAEGELTTARLLADLERDGPDSAVDRAGLAWEVAAERATPEQRAQGEAIAARQAEERAAVAGLFGPDGKPQGGR
jgi:hypothetical protein